MLGKAKDDGDKFVENEEIVKSASETLEKELVETTLVRDTEGSNKNHFEGKLTAESTFNAALALEKETLSSRIKELETELAHAKEMITKGLAEKERIANEAVSVAKRLKAIEAMGKIYEQDEDEAWGKE